MWVVGLTGGIGSGKSTVAEDFARFGVPVIDTDVIARQLTAPGGSALAAIQATFGEGILLPDGTLDRAALRRRIFADAGARHRLEAILHPLIRQQVIQALATLNAPYALIVIPLLVETGDYKDLLDRVLVVDCPETLQIERVMARSGLARDEVESIMATQAGRAERFAVADDTITNDGPPEALRAKVAVLHQDYLARAAASAP